MQRSSSRAAPAHQNGGTAAAGWRLVRPWRLATPCSVSCAVPVRCFNIAPPPTLTHSGETKINLVVTHQFPGHFQDPIVSVTSLTLWNYLWPTLWSRWPWKPRTEKEQFDKSCILACNCRGVLHSRLLVLYVLKPHSLHRLIHDLFCISQIFAFKWLFRAIHFALWSSCLPTFPCYIWWNCPWIAILQYMWILKTKILQRALICPCPIWNKSTQMSLLSTTGYTM